MFDHIKQQVKEHPRIAVGVGVVCVIVFVLIVRGSSKSSSTATTGNVTTTTAASNNYDLQMAQIGAQESASQLTAETQQQEDADTLQSAQAQYAAELDATKDKDNTSVLINAQNVDLAKTQSNNALSATQAQYTALSNQYATQYAAQTEQVKAQLSTQLAETQAQDNYQNQQLSAITGLMETQYNDQLSAQKVSAIAGLNANYSSTVNNEDLSEKPWQSYGPTSSAIDQISKIGT